MNLHAMPAAVGRTVFRTASVLAFAFGILNPAIAQQGGPPGASHDHWTALTMSPTGSWGAATAPSTNQAITGAIANCKAMSQTRIGCGTSFTTIQAGWSLGIRCGLENIIVAAKTLADAEQAAIRREIELRQLYVSDLPSCRRMVTVDPEGAAIPSYPGEEPRDKDRTTIR